MRTETEVTNSLSGVSGASEDGGVLTGRGSQCQLVQSDGLTTSLEDSSLGTGSESQSSNSDLGGVQQSDVIGNGTNNDDSLTLSTLLDGSVDLGNRHWGSVDLGEEQRLENGLVELGVGTAWRLV